MIYVSDIKYDLMALLPDGGRLHLQEALRGLSWEEQAGELAVRLQARIQNQSLGNGWLHQKLPLGGRTLLHAAWGQGFREIHQGVIFGWDYQKDPLGWFSITSYDPLIYLMKSKDDRFYPNGTHARVIIEDIAKAWGIPLGTVEGPDVALAKQTFRGKTLADMLLSVLDQAQKRGGGKFIIRSSGGKIDVVRTGRNSTIYHFGQEDNVQTMSDQQDIEDLITRVKIIGAEDSEGRSPVISTLDGRTEFGVLQDIVYLEQYDTEAAAKKAAQEILDERGKPRKRRKVVAPDLPFIRRGDKVSINAGTLGGYFIVSGIQHDADTRTMTMEVEDA